MNATEAMEIDKNKDGKIEVYLNTEDDVEYLFGLNSGFAYASPINIDRWLNQHDNFILV